tara:strand:+ start:2350 stop:5046 length:2697 start_codon:yes stop_codon:yes gene_type:complete
MTEKVTESTNVLKHKLLAPQPGQTSVQRRSLVQQIATTEGVRCVIIQAPAGHGKTTLLSQLVTHSEERGISSAWLTLDEADNDIHRLLAHLDEMLGSLEESCDSQPLSSRGSASIPATWADLFVSRIIDIGNPTHLFFDDFHSIEERDVESFFTDVLRNLPDTTTVFIATRKLPNVGISELQVRERMHLLRYDELKFSLDEAREFFQQRESIQLNEAELKTIHSRSEGWPAALQLFRLSLAKDGAKASLDSLESYTPFQITEYLTTNVLQSQPDDLQEFILKSSHLRKLTPPLCDHVLRRQDSRDILVRLENEGLFLNSLDSEKNWFQFHGLFSRYLQKLCDRRFPKIGLSINKNAAQWYFDNSHFEDCLFHSIRAQDFSLASEAMDVWASTQIASACLLSVVRIAQRIPLQHIEKKPTLAVKVTWALTFLRNRKNLVPYLNILKKIEQTPLDNQFRTELEITKAVVELSLDNLESSFAITEVVDTGDHTAEDFWAFELGAAANIQAFREIAFGNFSDARYYIAIGRNHSQHANAAFPAGYNVGLSVMNSYLQGRVSEAAEQAATAIKAEDFATKDSYAAASAVCCAFFPLYEINNAAAVLSAFERHRSDIDTGLLLDFVAAGYLPVIRIYDGLGERQNAGNLLDDLEQIAIGANWPRLISLCAWERVRRSLYAGNISEAVYLSRSAPEEAGTNYLTFINALEDPSLGRLRLEAHTAEADEVSATGERLSKQIEQARHSNRIAREVKLRLFKAVLKHNADDKQAAQKELNIALTLAQDYGFHRTVCDEGPIIHTLLEQVNLADWPLALRRFATTLMDTINASRGQLATSKPTEPLEPLTKREMQMLTLLAKGDSNKTIAKLLFVSENTVKFHLKNIYHKLGVTTRTQAISSAHSLNLL